MQYPNPNIPVRDITGRVTRLAKATPNYAKWYGKGAVIYGGFAGLLLLHIVEPSFVYKYIPYFSNFHQEK